MWESWDEREESGVSGNTGAAGGTEQHVSSHHHALVLVLGLAVDHHRVDGVSLDPDSMEVARVGHGLETDFKGTVGALHGNLLLPKRLGFARSAQNNRTGTECLDPHSPSLPFSHPSASTARGGTTLSLYQTPPSQTSISRLANQFTYALLIVSLHPSSLELPPSHPHFSPRKPVHLRTADGQPSSPPSLLPSLPTFLTW